MKTIFATILFCFSYSILFLSCNTLKVEELNLTIRTLSFFYDKDCDCFKKGVELGTSEMVLSIKSQKINSQELLLKGILHDDMDEPLYAVISRITEEAEKEFRVIPIDTTDMSGKFDFIINPKEKYIFHTLGFAPLLLEIESSTTPN
jgi:hypothetical protein